MVKAQMAEFPEASLNVYTTVVVPTENESPGLAEEVGVTEPESSTAVGSVHVTATAAPFNVVWTVMSLGQFEMTGAVLSTEAVSSMK